MNTNETRRRRDLVVGERVCFRSAVVARAGHDKTTADMRGQILAIKSGGKVASVDCGATYTADDGRTVRSIPVANLQRILQGGQYEDEI